MRLRPITTVPILLSCLLLGTALAKPTFVSVDELRASEQQRQAALIITQVMEKFHYRKPHLDDEMSAAIFERYLESLDANRSFFSAQDIARFFQDGFRNQDLPAHGVGFDAAGHVDAASHHGILASFARTDVSDDHLRFIQSNPHLKLG